VFLIREAIEASLLSAELRVLSDGEAAIQLIDAIDANDDNWCPSLFLLDLNLPKKTGIDVLRHIRRSRRCSQAAILIITSSDSESDRAETAQLGANGYFRKPSSYDAFIRLGEVIREMLGGEREA
jgi:chemotaxis family two-component system response regulator Rcp1